MFLFKGSLPKESKQSAGVYYIVNGMNQCHDCPKEIGKFLNSRKIIPIMIYRCFDSPLVNEHLGKEMIISYGADFDFLIDCDSVFYGRNTIEKNFPFVVAVFGVDTVIITHNEMFSGGRSLLNKKALTRLM